MEKRLLEISLDEDVEIVEITENNKNDIAYRQMIRIIAYKEQLSK